MSEQTEVNAIERKVDRGRTDLIPVGQRLGEPYGIRFSNVGEIIEWAKMMALDPTMPKHLLGRPATCLHVVSDAIGWQMDPFKVALMSFVVNGSICYMAQMSVAVINKHAPIKGRVRYSYEGTDDKRTCTAEATCADDGEVVEYTTPEIGKITPKNSPLWKTDPDQQLCYYAGRALCRRYFPDVLLGTYFRDEVTDNPRMVEHVNYERIENPLGGDSMPANGTAKGDEPNDAPGKAQDAPGAGTEGRQPADAKSHHEPPAEAGEAKKPPARKRTRPDGGTAAEGNGNIAAPANDASSSAPAPPRLSDVPMEEFPQPWVKRTPAEYIAYAQRWISAQDDKTAARARWDKERAIRNGLGSALEPVQVKELQNMLGRVGS